MMEKHLYKYVRNKYGHLWTHSDLCWCVQRSREVYLGRDRHLYEFKYPAEAGDPYCRCEKPVVDVECHNDWVFKRCKCCGKALDNRG